jgi:hypothetical protein
MAVTYSHAVSNAKNDAVETTIGASPILRVYSGDVPTNARTALVAQVLRAEGTLPSDWMAASANGVKAKTGTWTLTGESGASNSAGTFYRIYDNGDTTCHEQGTFTATGDGGDMTVDTNSITAGQIITVATYQKTAGNIG